MVQQGAFENPGRRQPSEPPQFWLAVLAGSLVIHSGLFVGLRWVTGQLFTPTLNPPPIEVELLETPPPQPIKKAVTLPPEKPTDPPKLSPQVSTPPRRSGSPTHSVALAPPRPAPTPPAPSPSASGQPIRVSPSPTPKPIPSSTSTPKPRATPGESTAEGGTPIASGVPLTTLVTSRIDAAQLQPESVREIGPVKSAMLTVSFPPEISIGFRSSLKPGQVLQVKVAFAIDHLTGRLIEDSLRVESEPIAGLSQADLQAIAEKILSAGTFQAKIETDAAQEADASAWEGELEVRIF